MSTIVLDKYNEPVFPDKQNLPRTRQDYIWCKENDYIIPAFRDGEVTVDKLLDYVDMKLEWYVPSMEAIKFMVFIRQCVGEEPENLNSLAQYFFIDCIKII